MPFSDSGVPDCDDDLPVTSTEADVQTPPAIDSSFGGWLVSIDKLDAPDGDGDYESATTGAWDYDIVNEGETIYIPTIRPVTRPRVTSTARTVIREVKKTGALGDVLKALSRSVGYHVKAKRAVESAVDQERRRRCKVSKRQHKRFRPI